MKTIDFEKFIKIHNAIEAKMLKIADAKNVPILRFDRKLFLDEDTLIYTSKDQDFGKTKKSTISIKIHEINEPIEYFLAQYNEEVRLAKEKEEEEKQEHLIEIEKKERREYERLLKKFGSMCLENKLKEIYKETPASDKQIEYSDVVACDQGGC